MRLQALRMVDRDHAVMEFVTTDGETRTYEIAYGPVPGRPGAITYRIEEAFQPWMLLELQGWPGGIDHRTFTDMVLTFRSIALSHWASDDDIRELEERHRAETASRSLDADGIRKQVYDLTRSDLERYPVWVFARDEEDVEGQDEATVRPVPQQEVAYDGDVGRTTFVASDGTHFLGYVTPDAGRDPGWLQPTIVTEGGQVNFWFGWQEAGVSDAMIEPLYTLLGRSGDELFPISYRMDMPWANASPSRIFEGRISGFGGLPHLGEPDVEERR